MSQALSGKRILVTRAAEQSQRLIKQLEALGAVAVCVPAITISGPEAPDLLTQAFAALSQYSWLVLTSQNSVLQTSSIVDWNSVVERQGAAEASLRVACVGGKTAAALESRGISVDLIAKPANADALLRQMSHHVSADDRILLLQGGLADASLATGLRHCGAEVDRFISYQTTVKAQNPEFRRALQDGIDAILFTSGSTIEGSCADWSRAAFAAAMNETLVLSIGPKTSAVLREFGVTSITEARNQSLDSMVQSLIKKLVGRLTGLTDNTTARFTNEEQTHGR